MFEIIKIWFCVVFMYKVYLFCQNKHMTKFILKTKKNIILILLIAVVLTLAAFIVVLGLALSQNEPVYNGIFV